MNSIERLRRFAPSPSHLWPSPLRTIKPLGRAKTLRPVIQVRSLILLLVAHVHAFLFEVR
jgi:hypothetical protein